MYIAILHQNSWFGIDSIPLAPLRYFKTNIPPMQYSENADIIIRKNTDAPLIWEGLTGQQLFDLKTRTCSSIKILFNCLQNIWF